MIKILVVEDDATIRSSIRELLESNNYKVFTAPDGIEGLELAKEIEPDLIICDIMMPKLDGYEVLERLKKEPFYKSIPFIYLTAKAEISDLRNGMELGADDYVPKPFRAINLLKAIEKRLERFKEIKEEKNQSDTNPVVTKKENLTENDRLFVNDKEKPRLIKVGDILWIKANGEYSNICMIDGSKFLVRKLIKEWEIQLSDKLFLRIHRSTIVNINFIDRIEKWSNRSYIIFLKNTDEKFVVSQRYAQKIKANLLV